ncbi:MAG: hypothetical protein II008_08130, partial [Oscillospiraceae bacterium]|nr:hypothetical protein [Oscillospiraceae bacterium]
MAEIYNFRPEDAERFAMERGIKYKHRGDELVFKWCPYCQGDNKDKETFAISLTTGQFNCKRSSCSVRGNMVTLARDFNFSLGRDSDTYYGIPWQRFKTFTKKAESIEPSDAAEEYFQTRGISPETVRKYHITARKDNDA